MMIKNGNRYSIGQFSIRSSFKIDSKRMVMKMKNIRIEEGGFLEGVVFFCNIFIENEKKITSNE